MVDIGNSPLFVVDKETEFKDNYFMLFFFPMDFRVDSSQLLSLKEQDNKRAAKESKILQSNRKMRSLT